MTATASRRQRGATLIVTLIMLVLLTMFVLAGFNLSNVNLKIAGNYQQQKETEAQVGRVLEQVMSTVSIFTTPAAVCLPSGATPSGNPLKCSSTSDVLVGKPSCNYTAPAKGYTKKLGELTPEDTSWEIRASYTDPVTKASTAIVQGVGVRLLSGNCPTS